ncbi:MAG: sortase [Lachnospiraceae bacterium]|nr:sortase [Lachnospiraceae bacterium]
MQNNNKKHLLSTPGDARGTDSGSGVKKSPGRRRIRRGTIMMVLGAMMLIGALSLFLHNRRIEEEAGEASVEIVSELSALIKAQAPMTRSSDDDDPLSYNLPSSEGGKGTGQGAVGEASGYEDPFGESQEINAPTKYHPDDAELATGEVSEAPPETQAAHQDDPAPAQPQPAAPAVTRRPTTRQMECVELNGYTYIGILDMPTLGLSLPIQWGWSDELLSVSPCRYDGSTYDNNMIILAHNYSTHFGTIKNLRPGDRLTFTNVYGEVINYQVIGSESFHRSRIEQMYMGSWDLTLFTCVPNTYNRLAVRCVRV